MASVRTSEPPKVRAHADVAGGAVGELADVAVQLGHEALAEAHDLHVALALGVKVRAALAAAHGQGGEAVLEHLLEAEELEDALVDGGMEAQAALVGADGAVELDAVAAVDLHLALVVHPGHTEGDDPLGLHQALDQAGLLVLGVLFHQGLDALQHLDHRLQELGLVGVAPGQALVDALQIFVRQHSERYSFPNPGAAGGRSGPPLPRSFTRTLPSEPAPVKTAGPLWRRVLYYYKAFRKNFQ